MAAASGSMNEEVYRPCHLSGSNPAASWRREVFVYR